ncbi:MAG: hypothetical protein JOZ58_23145 [Acetobacteraceae bacterium]|nr:hypothetical protein [Acetobacteraceae bacterium]
MGEELHRRAFLAAGGSTVLAGTVAWGGSPTLAQAQSLLRNAIEQRVAAVVEAYDAQGNHRTATATDNMCAEW